MPRAANITHGKPARMSTLRRFNRSTLWNFLHSAPLVGEQIHSKKPITLPNDRRVAMALRAQRKTTAVIDRKLDSNSTTSLWNGVAGVRLVEANHSTKKVTVQGEVDAVECHRLAQRPIQRWISFAEAHISFFFLPSICGSVSNPNTKELDPVRREQVATRRQGRKSHYRNI